MIDPGELISHRGYPAIFGSSWPARPAYPFRRSRYW
jgi:hypothetical protein